MSARVVGIGIAGSWIAIAALVASVGLAGCGSDGSSPNGRAFPMWADDNGNGINDYYEGGTHDPGSPTARFVPSMHGPGMGAPSNESPRVPGMHGGPDHAFVDENGEGICDYAQNGSSTWHGPGWIDADGNGVCDYWQAGSPAYGMGGGMMFRDTNGNGINDYVERSGHVGMGHDFVDQNADGICDYAQTGGSATWHGPGAVDSNHDGMPDMWAPGMPGHGGMMGGG